MPVTVFQVFEESENGRPIEMAFSEVNSKASQTRGFRKSLPGCAFSQSYG